jgi:ADP-ribose pyrophosphatase YjhB (NUDIX family)
MQEIVFIKDKPIYLSDELSEDLLLNSQLIIQYDGCRDIELTVKLFEDSPSIKSLLIYSDNFKKLKDAFVSQYKIIEAAGGIVFNPNNEVLLIHRYDRWDLPKGKMESGETPEISALREVEEECGIKKIFIVRALQNTYHCFEHLGEKTIKITHWYKMQVAELNGELKPQIEEGITDVKWFSKSNLNNAMQTAYNSIHNVVAESLNS